MLSLVCGCLEELSRNRIPFCNIYNLARTRVSARFENYSIMALS